MKQESRCTFIRTLYVFKKCYFDHVGYLLLNSYRKKVNVKLKKKSINISRMHTNSRAAEFSERLQPARSFSNAAVFPGLSKTVDKRPNGKRKRCVFVGFFFSSPRVVRLWVLFFKDWQTPPDEGLELQSFNWIVHLGEAGPPPPPPSPNPTPAHPLLLLCLTPSQTLAAVALTTHHNCIIIRFFARGPAKSRVGGSAGRWMNGGRGK